MQYQGLCQHTLKTRERPWVGGNGMHGEVREERKEPGRGCVQITKRGKWEGQFLGLATRRSLVNTAGAVLGYRCGPKTAEWEQVSGSCEQVISWRG